MKLVLFIDGGHSLIAAGAVIAELLEEATGASVSFQLTENLMPNSTNELDDGLDVDAAILHFLVNREATVESELTRISTIITVFRELFPRIPFAFWYDAAGSDLKVEKNQFPARPQVIIDTDMCGHAPQILEFVESIMEKL